MLDPRKGVIEVVQQCAPLLVARRLAEADCMVLELLPFDQQKVAVRRLEAALDRDRAEARRRRDQRPRLFHCGFEGGFLAGLHIEQGGFQDHQSTILPGSGARSPGITATIRCSTWPSRPSGRIRVSSSNVLVSKAPSLR